MKIFSRSRRQLLSDSKIMRYVIYAFGEIVLVVIGILIAVHIGNLNEASERRTEELTHLRNILSDLEKDKIGLLQIIDRFADKKKSAIMMGKFHSGEMKVDPAVYYHEMTNVLFWEAYHPQIISVDELINSGKLSIIGNAEIKRLLLDIKAAYLDASSIEGHVYNDLTNFLYLKLGSMVDYGDVFKVYFDPKAKIALSESAIQLALKEKSIKNGFTLAELGYEGLEIEMKEILVKESKAIELITKEINR